MHARDAHPSDEQLFDLIEGRLDAAQASEVEAHLETCAECAALVQAAIGGSPDDTVPVEAMPPAAVEALDQAVATEWRERRARILAQEAAAPAPQYVPPAAEPTTRPLRPARRRWLVPACAAAVLAMLAGTGVWLGGQPAATNSSDESTQATSRPEDASTSGEPQGDVASPAATPEAGAPAAAAGNSAAGGASPAVGSPTSNQALSDAADAAKHDTVVPPIGIDQYSPNVCVAVFGNGPLALPDGRIPQQVVTGPFRITLVCG